MTDSSMRCCTRLFRLCCLVLMLVASPASQGNDIVARNAVLSPSEDGYTLAADFTVNLNARLDEAIARGIALYFVVEFELTRSRWYWLDEQVVSRSQTFQLSYHALTRQYRLYSGALHQSFTSLDDALRIMSRVRNWQVIDKNQLRPDQSYQAAVRMRLDLSQMPKTFQVNALANRDWSLSSEWVRWAVIGADSAPGPGNSSGSPVAGPVEAR
ncbi:DUF4390 domain-containing protein [Accumulibacter sp.]|uniref:DUF4390 domain-containing protein n=1 Tax=Accumulibacter sp. TaxID=2053492 RepID=UPI0025DFB1E1|nr:DUF4390 domain-containing protein [Accumulibacter sp.]MCM8594679.1 DUF4390 domain-containing protein [Accumulibacter sp.]MCM8625905.1 DUF4390 domain-containing protein [Accumulibacter sp.]MDS4048825.1 DUF4390 domain-containing protein [Accumulibacter sp.]